MNRALGTRPEREESGSASVLGVQVIAMLAVVTLVACAVTALVVAHRRAQAAADLGALAGATAVQQGGAACAAAGRVVSANRATLSDCAVAGQTVQVTVLVRSPPLLGRVRDLSASARAGPAADVADGWGSTPGPTGYGGRTSEERASEESCPTPGRRCTTRITARASARS